MASKARGRSLSVPPRLASCPPEAASGEGLHDPNAFPSLKAGVLTQIKEALRSQAAHDVAPTELSHAARYIQDDLSHEGYRHLLAVSALLTLLPVC